MVESMTRVLGDDPPRRMIETVSVVCVVGSQSISKVDPAATLEPFAGEVMASNPAVWATT
jgi:hypothetical protein